MRDKAHTGNREADEKDLHAPLATNPNPRANENLPAEHRDGGSPESSEGSSVGTEITDGEAG